VSAGRPRLYRFEFKGVVVYDSKAKVAGRPGKLAPFHPAADENSKFIHGGRVEFTDELRKELDTVDPYDRKSFIKMKGYNSMPEYAPEYIIEIPQDEDTLIFDSHFESGNLRKAIKVSANQYNLMLDYDTETQTYTQWYYFCV
jgi:hypothetical protein